MSTTLVIFGMAVVTFVPRWLGFRLSGRAVPEFWLNFFRFVPLAVFPALILPELTAVPGETVLRTAVALMAGLLVWKFRRLWLGLFAGLAVFLALRWLL